MREDILLEIFELIVVIAALVFLLVMPFYPYFVNAIDSVEIGITEEPTKKPAIKDDVHIGPYTNPGEIKGYFEYVFNVTKEEMLNLPDEYLELCKFKKDSVLYIACLTAIQKKQNNIEIESIAKANRTDYKVDNCTPIGIKTSGGQYYICYYWNDMVFIKHVKYDCILFE